MSMRKYVHFSTNLMFFHIFSQWDLCDFREPRNLPLQGGVLSCGHRPRTQTEQWPHLCVCIRMRTYVHHIYIYISYNHIIILYMPCGGLCQTVRMTKCDAIKPQLAHAVPKCVALPKHTAALACLLRSCL